LNVLIFISISSNVAVSDLNEKKKVLILTKIISLKLSSNIASLILYYQFVLGMFLFFDQISAYKNKRLLIYTIIMPMLFCR